CAGARGAPAGPPTATAAGARPPAGRGGARGGGGEGASPATAASTAGGGSTRSSRQRVHHDVHAEPRVVDRLEALVAVVVAPLGAVVLVGVEHAQPPVDLHPQQV